MCSNVDPPNNSSLSRKVPRHLFHHLLLPGRSILRRANSPIGRLIVSPVKDVSPLVSRGSSREEIIVVARHLAPLQPVKINPPLYHLANESTRRGSSPWRSASSSPSLKKVAVARRRSSPSCSLAAIKIDPPLQHLANRLTSLRRSSELVVSSLPPRLQLLSFLPPLLRARSSCLCRLESSRLLSSLQLFTSRHCSINSGSSLYCCCCCVGSYADPVYATVLPLPRLLLLTFLPPQYRSSADEVLKSVRVAAASSSK